MLGDFSVQEHGEKTVASKVMEHGRRIGPLPTRVIGFAKLWPRAFCIAPWERFLPLYRQARGT